MSRARDLSRVAVDGQDIIPHDPARSYTPGSAGWYLNLLDKAATGLASVADLADVNPTYFQTVYLSAAGREGQFVWNETNHSSQVTSDPLKGMYVPPASDTTGASGAWVRVIEGPILASWWGLRAGASASTNNAALSAALSLGSGRNVVMNVFGTFALSQNFDLTGKNGTVIEGMGEGVTIIDFQHASADLFSLDTTSADASKIEIGSFSVTSTVTRAGGWVVNFKGGQTSGFYPKNCKISNIFMAKQYNGIAVRKFLFTDVFDIYGEDWIGTGGRGFQAGQTTTSSENQGAELRLRNVQLRGGTGNASLTPGLSFGFWLEGCEGVYLENSCQAVSCKSSNLVFATNAGGHVLSNIFLTSTIFDGTESDHCVKFTGSGQAKRIAFDGAWWIASGGKLGATSNSAAGLHIPSTVTVDGLDLTGGRFYNNSNSAILDEAQNTGLSYDGTAFQANGVANLAPQVKIDPSAVATRGRNLVGGKFSEGSGRDIVFTANARGDIVNDNAAPLGIRHAGISAKVVGNSTVEDINLTLATSIPVRMTEDFYIVNGAGEFTSLDPSYDGQVVTLLFTGIATKSVGTGNFRLINGALTTQSGTVVTAMYGVNGWWEISRGNT